MAPPEDNASRSSEERATGDVPLQNTREPALQNEQQEDPITLSTDEPDPWAISAEGYTPLTDIGADGAMLFMVSPPDEDDDEQEGYGGTYRGGEINIDDQDTQSCDSEQSIQLEADAPEDFSALADQALKSLDDEYQATLRPLGVGDANETHVAPSDNEEFCETSRVHVNQEGFGKQADVPSDAHVLNRELPKKEHPPLDTEAIRRAVDSIQLKDPGLTSNMERWQGEGAKKFEQTVAPRVHSVIPQAPLSAFRKRTTKAIHATSNLSRSCTLAEAIVRLSCLSSSKERLTVHVVGADHLECQTQELIRNTFAPFVRWVGACELAPCSIDIQLIGPNVPRVAAAWPPVSLMSKAKLKASSPLVEAMARCHACVYDEWIESHRTRADWHAPDLAIAFNSGIWGYKEWRPTLRRFCELNLLIPFISTAYTIQEAEDDSDVIADEVNAAGGSSDTVAGKLLWGVESNPFGSRKTRTTATAIPGRDYRENSAWQAWRL